MKKTNKQKSNNNNNKVGSEEVLEFGIGLGWLGWECQIYLWTAGAGTAPASPTAAGGLGKGAAAAGTAGSSRAARTGEKSCKKTLQKPFSCPCLGSSAPILSRERWAFPCRGSGRCSLVSGVAFVQVGVELGLERGSRELWNLQNRFHRLKIKDLPGLPAGLRGAVPRAAGAFPFPRLPSPPGSLG